MCFAVLLTKTGRVYHIFTNPTPNKKVAKHHGMDIAIATEINLVL